jgi:hypothetical protein
MKYRFAASVNGTRIAIFCSSNSNDERSDPMTERSYQDAVQVLKDRLGSRWEGVETEGRDEMESILRDQLGYDRPTARDAIDAMIQSGTLRYHRNVERTGDEVTPVAPVAPVAGGVASTGAGLGGTSSGAGLGGVPLAAGVVVTAGHWQIGSGEGGENDTPGRAGQVTPR